MFEKLCGWMLGRGLNCLLVNCANSNATSRPKAVTRRAANFRRGDIVMIGVLGRIMFEVISSPAKMLPQASRLIGFSTAGLFSLIGDRGLNRGCPMATKYTTRRL